MSEWCKAEDTKKVVRAYKSRDKKKFFFCGNVNFFEESRWNAREVKKNPRVLWTENSRITFFSIMR